MRVAATDRAQSEYILQVKRAEGEAETKYLSGVGVARQRQVRDCTACFCGNFVEKADMCK